MGAMEISTWLDEFRPFRRGEIALARREARDPLVLHPRRRDLLRYALRLAQLSTLGPERDDLVDRIGSLRLRLLQLLAPVLPTDPERIEPERLDARLDRAARLVDEARRRIAAAGLASPEQIDAELANKRLALVLGGAAGSGYVFLGALERLAKLGLAPAYLTGCSVGSVLAVVRGRERGFELEALLDDVQRLRERGAFAAPDPAPRFGLPAALRLDLRRALGELFADPARGGAQRRLRDLAIPTDVLATGLGPGALAEPREAFSHWGDLDVASADALARLPRGALARAVASLVSLAMSRRVLVPLFLGADPDTAELAALDAAALSAAIPALLQVDLPPGEVRGAEVLEAIFRTHALAGVVDGALSSLVPARYTWEAIEAGRLGGRNAVIVALDAMAKPTGTNVLLAPLFRVISATADRDRAFWDLHVNFRRAPPFLDLFPTAARLRRAAEQGGAEFSETARVLRALLAPLPPWKELVAGIDLAPDDGFTTRRSRA
jgi:predicted acylesterase/phospholipase RssA